MRGAILFLVLVACRSEYTRCKACFTDDPSGYCVDHRETESLGQKDPNFARCSAAVDLCDGIESRAMGGIPDPKHEAACKDPPKAWECTPAFLGKFQLECSTQKVGGMVPF